MIESVSSAVCQLVFRHPPTSSDHVPMMWRDLSEAASHPFHIRRTVNTIGEFIANGSKETSASEANGTKSLDHNENKVVGIINIIAMIGV